MIFNLDKIKSGRDIFIEEYMMPLYEIAAEYLSQYGIESGTVYAMPLLILGLIFAILFVIKRETKCFEFYYMLVVIVISVWIIIDCQCGFHFLWK
jgi:hypothetical protein